MAHEASMRAASGEERYAISLESVQQAAQRIANDAHRTPVITSQTLDAMASDAYSRGSSALDKSPRVRLFFKCENLQKIGAFKYRGALNAVKKYHEEHPGERDTTFVAHSGGNHAQAVALAAKNNGAKAVIVMPENAPSVKLDAVRGYGAELILTEPTGEAREAAVQRYMRKFGGYFIHPANDPEVMSGQGTAVVELLEQVQHEYGVALDAIILPVGGGGLCAGGALAAKSLSKRIKVFGAEPVGAADAHLSLQRGELSSHDTPPHSIADGLRTTIGDLTWQVIRDFVDAIALVQEEDIVATMKLIWERMKLVAEPSSAVAVAAALSSSFLGESMAGSSDDGNGTLNVGIVVTGGNVDLDHLPWLRV